ncbi:MAG: hydrogenase nickel incorporation protein HypB [Planctomycetales bacterium]
MSNVTVPLNLDVRSRQNADAARLRAELEERGILCINMISSPGAGKTSLLQAMARHWGTRLRLGVLVGDIATTRDADRLAPLVPVRQLSTGGACHLEIDLVRRGLTELDLNAIDILVIENVGNLVCPSSYDLGEHVRVVVLSVTEGDDKPGKYPKAFRTSDVCVISKIDLLPYVPFSLANVTSDAQQVRGDLVIQGVSAVSGEGIADWCHLLEVRRQEWLARRTHASQAAAR